MIDKKQKLKELVQNSVILNDRDKKITISRLADFSVIKIDRLIDLFQKEQDKINSFADESKKIKSEYQHVLAKDIKLMHTASEEIESNPIENLLEESLKQI